MNKSSVCSSCIAAWNIGKHWFQRPCWKLQTSASSARTKSMTSTPKWCIKVPSPAQTKASTRTPSEQHPDSNKSTLKFIDTQRGFSQLQSETFLRFSCRDCLTLLRGGIVVDTQSSPGSSPWCIGQDHRNLLLVACDCLQVRKDARSHSETWRCTELLVEGLCFQSFSGYPKKTLGEASGMIFLSHSSHCNILRTIFQKCSLMHFATRIFLLEPC